ncbi:MAG: hypothetical protein QNJ77_02650 [Acidimicrobiia bacterium]|nr:hypothetical protein [Acidimicrobiia bacterium]
MDKRRTVARDSQKALSAALRDSDSASVVVGSEDPGALVVDVESVDDVHPATRAAATTIAKTVRSMVYSNARRPFHPPGTLSISPPVLLVNIHHAHIGTSARSLLDSRAEQSAAASSRHHCNPIAIQHAPTGRDWFG